MSENVVVLAGDLATFSGFAVGKQHPTCVSHRLPDLATVGEKLEAFEDFLCDLVEQHEPTWMAHEAPFVPNGAGMPTTRDTVLLLIKMCGVFELVAARYGCRTREVKVQTARKHFAGSGRADKADVAARCRALGWPASNHNESDACAVWSLSMALANPKWAPMATQLFALGRQGTTTGGSR